RAAAPAEKRQYEDDRKRAIVAEARPEPLVVRREEAEGKKEKGLSDAQTGVVGGVVSGNVAYDAAPMAKTAAAASLPPAPAPAAPAVLAEQAPATAAAAPKRDQEQDKLVERFARADRAVVAPQLDVEASAAPFDDAKQIVRVSLDGTRDAEPQVTFNDASVESWRAIATDGTSLYEVVLRPHRD